MVRYRRNFIPGASYFFTVVLRDRSATVLVDRIELLRNAFRAVQIRKPFRIDAAVILPDHLHAIWTLPDDDSDYPGRWKALKSHFTRHLSKAGRGHSTSAKAHEPVWQSRYWEHTISDQADFARHVEYIHHNPVKHGHVTSAIDWPYSSFHRYVRAGTYERDWAAEPGLLDRTGNE